MWIKLTRTNGNIVVVNFDRFDLLETIGDGTRISSTLSAADDDVAAIDVKESMTNIHAWLAHGITREEDES